MSSPTVALRLSRGGVVIVATYPRSETMMRNHLRSATEQTMNAKVGRVLKVVGVAAALMVGAALCVVGAPGKRDNAAPGQLSATAL